MLQQYGNFGDFLQRTSEHPPLIANLPIETGNMLQKWEVKHPSVRSLPRFPAPRQLDRLCPMLHAFRRGKQRGHSICHLPQWSHSRQRSHGNYSVIRFTPGRSWQILADPVSHLFSSSAYTSYKRKFVPLLDQFQVPDGKQMEKVYQKTSRSLGYQLPPGNLR